MTDSQVTNDELSRYTEYLADENTPPNESATQLWVQMFERMARSEGAALMDPTYDGRKDEERLRVALAAAGWSQTAIHDRIQIQKKRDAAAPVTSPGVAPHAEALFAMLCDDVEAAMARLNLKSQHQIARGIEPLVGPLVSMTNVIMTDQAIVTVGSFLFRFCGLIARACLRTIHLNPDGWQAAGYTEADGRRLLHGRPDLILYWLQIYVSFAMTGTHVLVPFRPATPAEAWGFEEIARAMEIFAIAHEYGHHYHEHGREMGADPKREEFEADQFALRVAYEVGRQGSPLFDATPAQTPSETLWSTAAGIAKREEATTGVRPKMSAVAVAIAFELERHAVPIPNPYLSSGAGGVVLLQALGTLANIKDALGIEREVSDTHPTITERLDRFGTVAMLNKYEFTSFEGFRTVCQRVMGAVESEVQGLLSAIPLEARMKWLEMFRDPAANPTETAGATPA